jgi:deoxyhypusine synthase
LEEMYHDGECTKILSFPACLVSTGTRGIIKELVKRKMADAIITASGTIDHDLARVWKDYLHGSFLMDDAELRRKGINREGNVLIPNECYGEIIEDKLQPIFDEIYKSGRKDMAPYEIVWEIGKRLENEKNKEDSIIYWAYKNKIPVFIPGVTDGAFGWQLWFFYQRHKDFNVNVLADDQRLSEIIYSSKKLGALMIGGGISKHHAIWWCQFRDGLDYAVYITTADEWDGSLSGARLREAVSWGKVKEKAKYITVEGDATTILPLLISALLERLAK